MSIEIKNFDGTVLHTVDADTLRGANLRGLDLSGANLRGLDLHGASLRGASLYGADLRGAYLRGEDLGGAYLGGAIISPSQAVDLVKALGVIVKEEV